MATEKRELLERVVALIDPADVGDPRITEARNLIAEGRIEPGMHVGKPPESFDERMTYEWCLGQVAKVIDDEAWWAMNGGLNVAHAQLDKYQAVANEPTSPKCAVSECRFPKVCAGLGACAVEQGTRLP